MSDVIIKTQNDLKVHLFKNYMTQIENFFADDKQAMKFLSSVMSSVQKNPKLLECRAETLINSFMTMAQLRLMPSDVSGEAYVLPYKNDAQFQLGYQGIITLFYRAGGTSLRSEIVRENDKFEYVNGEINHTIDIFKSREKRGKAVGAYAIALINNNEVASVMNSEDILNFGKQFSKSYSSQYSPWNEKNDPELWMWKKTVLKQLAKLLPKNETINLAIAEDNKSSKLNDKVKEGKVIETTSLKMGSLVKEPTNNQQNEETKQTTEGSQDEYYDIPYEG